MYKCLTVVALVLLVLTGAMGLRNIVAANAATILSLQSLGPCNLGKWWRSDSANSARRRRPYLGERRWSNSADSAGWRWTCSGERWRSDPPIPPGGGGHVRANGGGPIPPIPPGGGGH